MKKYAIYFLMITLVTFYACNEDELPELKTLVVQLAYPANSEFSALEGVEVIITSGAVSYTETTDADGKATFTVPLGIYEVSASKSGGSDGGASYVYNGLVSNITVTRNWSTTDIVMINLAESKLNQIVIKELFMGGTLKDDGSGAFNYDRYVILYNNSGVAANLGNMCLATIAPYNAQATNNYYGTDGVLKYANEGWIPAAQAIWYFKQNVTIEPGKQIVVALANAVNNTVTYSNSINFDNAEYYCTYDNEAFTHATYVSPVASIPTNHYLDAIKYGAGSAWTLSNTSPGLFIFETNGTTPEAFVADASITDASIAGYVSKKVPTDWIIDGLEAYLLGNSNNKKRFTPAIDAGYVYHLNGQGYSIYRNVDKAATEALAENAGKLVFNYSGGTSEFENGTTDPSGIDAEASVKNGARIIYKDSNNSTADFHLRKRASLRN